MKLWRDIRTNQKKLFKSFVLFNSESVGTSLPANRDAFHDSMFIFLTGHCFLAKHQEQRIQSGASWNRQIEHTAEKQQLHQGFHFLRMRKPPNLLKAVVVTSSRLTLELTVALVKVMPRILLGVRRHDHDGCWYPGLIGSGLPNWIFINKVLLP